MKNFGVISKGVKCPIIREGDDIVKIVVDSLLEATKTASGYDLDDRNIVGITESVIARSSGLFISVDDIAADVVTKFGKDARIVLINPIYSRNRFAMILKGIARVASEIVIVMPDFDEVGNPRGVNPFTGVNIEDYYKDICVKENAACRIVYSSEGIDSYCRIHCGLHCSSAAGGGYTLADICSDKCPDFGVLGTNKSTEERLKLFPTRELANRVCREVKDRLMAATGKDIIVCCYGDGCFKDPVGGIWEFADPVTMPGYTDSDIVESTPNELKLKYLIDKGMNDSEIEGHIRNDKASSLKGKMVSQGTTPRLYRDLLASLMDLTSGSGDRATPVILIQNYL